MTLPISLAQPLELLAERIGCLFELSGISRPCSLSIQGSTIPHPSHHPPSSAAPAAWPASAGWSAPPSSAAASFFAGGLLGIRPRSARSPHGVVGRLAIGRHRRRLELLALRLGQGRLRRGLLEPLPPLLLHLLSPLLERADRLFVRGAAPAARQVADPASRSTAATIRGSIAIRRTATSNRNSASATPAGSARPVRASPPRAGPAGRRSGPPASPARSAAPVPSVRPGFRQSAAGSSRCLQFPELRRIRGGDARLHGLPLALPALAVGEAHDVRAGMPASNFAS